MNVERLKRLERIALGVAPERHQRVVVGFQGDMEYYAEDYSIVPQQEARLVIERPCGFGDRFQEPDPELPESFCYSPPTAGLSEEQLRKVIERKAATRPYVNIGALIDGKPLGQDTRETPEDQQRRSDEAVTREAYLADLARMRDFSPPASRILWPTPIQPRWRN